jgi:hypothetical protein
MHNSELKCSPPPEAKQERLFIQPDFGVHPDELADRQLPPAPTVSALAGLLVGEEELHNNGRWGGAPPPRRRVPSGK